MPINKGLHQGSTGNEENQGGIGESEGLENQDPGKSEQSKSRAVKGRYIPKAGTYQGQANTKGKQK